MYRSVCIKVLEIFLVVVFILIELYIKIVGDKIVDVF